MTALEAKSHRVAELAECGTDLSAIAAELHIEADMVVELFGPSLWAGLVRRSLRRSDDIGDVARCAFMRPEPPPAFWVGNA